MAYAVTELDKNGEKVVAISGTLRGACREYFRRKGFASTVNPRRKPVVNLHLLKAARYVGQYLAHNDSMLLDSKTIQAHG